MDASKLRQQSLRLSVCPIVLLSLLTASAYTATAAPPDASEFDGPPIEGGLVKKDPDVRFKILIGQMTDQENPIKPSDFIARFDEIRKKFWDTYPDKEGHKEARQVFAQALFIKDLHYLQSDIWIKNLADVNTNRTPTSPNIHTDSTGNKLAQILGQAFTGTAMDGAINPDGDIPATALPEFNDWVDATRKALGPLTKRSNFDAVFVTTLKNGVSFFSEDYRKATNLSGKEYQAYLMERDWAEYDKANVIPDGYDNKEKYGVYLYFRNAGITLQHAKATYADMVTVLNTPTLSGKKLVEDAVEEVRTAPKTPDKKLFTKYPTPFKLSPSGEKIPDYDVPMPKNISGFFTNQQMQFEALACQYDTHAYLLYMLKIRYFDNQRNGHLKPETTKWSFAQSCYRALANSFGEQKVLDIAEKVRTATKRQATRTITIMDPASIGATRNEPVEAFDDILSRSDPVGYVKAALAFNQNINDPGSVDVNEAYKKFVATTGGGDEKALLAAAKRCTVGDLHWVANNPSFGYPTELIRIQNELTTPTPEKPPEILVQNPDYLAWKKFPDNAKVSYVVRGWKTDPRHPEQFTGPSNPSDRYTLSVKSRTADELVLWNSQISYDYPSGAASKPHDMEMGFPAMSPPARPREAGGGRISHARTKAGQALNPPDPPKTDSGDEILNVAGRSIPTHWTSTTRTNTSNGGGISYVSIMKMWTSDEIPGGLVRKTDESTVSSGSGISQHQLRETVLESFQGVTPGTPAPASAQAPGAPPAAPIAPAPQPAVVTPAVAPTPAPAPPPAPVPAPARVVRKRPNREPVTPAEAAAQKEIFKRYYAAAMRQNQIALQLVVNRKRGEAAPKLPDDISKAQTDSTAELAAVLQALRDRDMEEAQKQVQAAEDNLTTVEKYVKPAGELPAAPRSR